MERTTQPRDDYSTSLPTGEDLWRPWSIGDQVEGLMLAVRLQHLSFGEAMAHLQFRAEQTNGGKWDAIAFYAGFILNRRRREQAA